jgi:hypothetical protein
MLNMTLIFDRKVHAKSVALKFIWLAGDSGIFDKFLPHFSGFPTSMREVCG